MPDGARPDGPSSNHGGPNYGRVTVGVAAALGLCCAGHILLLAFGFASLGAAAGAPTGSTVLLVLAIVLLTVAGTAITARRRRRHHRHSTLGKDLP